MSGIFKGGSIYKTGAGGGYKDGGTLTPAEYITVPNNVIVEYENSADEINFIIDDDGKPHNSIINVSTSVNAIVNVYEIKNGFYYLMGIVGTNTVLAGQDYTVNIIGNSYVIENVTVQSSEPSAGSIDGQIYGIVKIGNTYWTDRFVKINQGNPVIKNDVYYYSAPLTVDGWRIPNDSEFAELSTTYPNTYNVKSTTGWSGGGGNGDNASNLNLYPNGYLDPYTKNPQELGRMSCFLFQWGTLLRIAKIADGYVNGNAYPAPIRLVHPA